MKKFSIILLLLLFAIAGLQVFFNHSAEEFVEGDLYDTSGFKCGYKAIATAGKMVYEAKNLSNYYLQNAKANTFNYTYSSTEFAKVKTEDGTIKIIGYTG